MGCYVEPPIDPALDGEHRGPGRPESAKDRWLKANAAPMDGLAIQWDAVPEDAILLCRVWNATWSAIGVAFSEGEMNRFLNGAAGRQTRWFIAPLDAVREVTRGQDDWSDEINRTLDEAEK